MKKINKKRIFTIFSLVLISFCICNMFLSNAFADINPDTSSIASKTAESFNAVVKGITDLVSSSIFAGFSNILLTLAGVLYLLLGLMFSGATGSIFPSTANIVFNRVAILDINFFNPNEMSILGKTDIVAQLYNSFQTIAISIFVIAAMVVGIKLALSSVAQEKAQCKKAITNWVMGIVILFMIRLILAGIFEMNEILVYRLSKAAAEKGTMEFKVELEEVVPGIVGKAIVGVIDAIAGLWTGSLHGNIEIACGTGYDGMITMYAAKAFGGDLLSAIVLFVLIGQTITFLVSYGKRLVYVILLGCVAPLIVAVDTINKSIKGQSTILSNWFKEIVLLVFTQTFHAMMMFLTLTLLISMNDTVSLRSFLGIAGIILTHGMAKFEKLYRQLFGISDSMMGNLQGQAGKMMAGLHGAVQAGKSLADNKKKADAAKKNIVAAQERKQKLVSSQEDVVHQQGSFCVDRAKNAMTAAELNPARSGEMYTYARGMLDEARKSGYDPKVIDKMEDYINKRTSGGGSGSDESRRRTTGATGAGAGGNASHGSSGVPEKNPVRFNYTDGEEVSPYDSMEWGYSEGEDMSDYSEVASSSTSTSTSTSHSTSTSTSNTNVNVNNTTNSNSTSHGSAAAASAGGGTGSGGNSQQGNGGNLGNDVVSHGNINNAVAENAFNEAQNSDMGEVVNELREIEDLLSREKDKRTMDKYGSAVADKKREIEAADKDIADAQKAYRSARFAQAMAPVNLAAGIGIGLGTGDDISSSMLKGGLTTAGLDALSEKIGTRVGTNVSSAIEKNINIGKAVRSALRDSDTRSNVGDL